MNADDRALFQAARTWVVKVGSSLLTDDGRGLDIGMIGRLAAQIAALRADGRRVVLVSSGAVAAGVARLGWPRRPSALPELQAAAALGQSALIGAYEQAFGHHALLTAQVLLGHDDVAARDRYLNARAALAALLQLGVVPVVNENDTVVTDEIRFGDNDTLAALVANLIDADVLVLLTDQQGLFEADPRRDPAAALVQRRAAADGRLDAMAGEGGRLGRGGMVTKLRAARLAARSGSETLIVDGRSSDVLQRLARGEAIGTWLESGQRPESARRQWLAGMLRVQGRLVIDDGAVRVLREAGRSLLPVGVCAVEGDFRRGDVVSCHSRQGVEVGRGLCNYNADEARQIAGRPSAEIARALGYGGDEEMIHRDNLVLVR